MPSLRSSAWIRGAPQRGFAATIRLTRALISALTGGRPPVGRAESLVQYSQKRRRCHRRTVFGVTITRGRRHPAQTLASTTQKSRSVRRRGGRTNDGSLVDVELLAQGQVLESEVALAANKEGDEPKQA